MRRALAALAAFLTLVWAQPTFAGSGDGMALMGVSQSGAGVTSSYVGPGDQTTFTAWYSCGQAYNGAYAAGGGLACNLRNTISNEQCDFAFVAAGTLGVAQSCTASSNGVSATTFCTGGCEATEMYDETGGGRHLVQATTAAQPPIVFGVLGIGNLPTLVWANATVTMSSSGNFTPATGVASFVAVADRSAGTGQVRMISENGTLAVNNNQFASANGSANAWSILGPSSSFNATAADAAAHVGVGVLNGASSVINIDGTETTGTATGNTVADPVFFRGGGASTTMEVAEMGFTDNVAFSPTVRTNLCHNMRARYGTSGSC